MGRALQEGLCPHVGDQESEFVFKESASDLIWPQVRIYVEAVRIPLLQFFLFNIV